LKNSLV